MAGGGDGGGTDPNTYVNEAGCRGARCDAQTPCPGGRRCVQSVCFADNGTCAKDDECENDTRCYMGACIPWDECSKLPHSDPACEGQVFTPDEFKPPVVGCSLTSV